jgi:protein-tyrosine phosphatase
VLTQKESAIYVHCSFGISRAPTIVIAYLMEYEGLALRQAYETVYQRRPIIGPNLHFMFHLILFEQFLRHRPKGVCVAASEILSAPELVACIDFDCDCGMLS